MSACTLTHLDDDQGVTFTEHAHLPTRSRDTLVHFEMRWISESGLRTLLLPRCHSANAGAT